MLWPALAVIVVVTAVTVEVSAPFVDRAVSRKIVQSDVIFNLLLYVPLGMALHKRRLIWIVAMAGSVSVFAECVQLFYPDRFPSPIDVVTNVVGAGVGAGSARLFARLLRYDLTVIRLGIVTGILAIAAWATIVLAQRQPDDYVELTSFSNWDSTFQIAVGNELSGDRLWRGRIIEAAILSDALDGKAVKRLHAGGSKSLRNVSTGERALFALPDGMSDGDSLWGKPLVGTRQTRRIFERLTTQNTLSVLVWFQGTDSDPKGLARIITYSRDMHGRNFTLGQGGRRIHFRLRTPMTLDNGLYPETITPGRVNANRDVFLAAVYDGRVSRVYLDGHVVARVNLAAYAWTIPFLADSGLPAAATLTGMLMAAGILSLGGCAVRRRKWLAAPLGGVIGATALIAAGATEALPQFVPWVPLLGLAAGAHIAASTTFCGKR
jgi:VanZ family protein